MTAFCGGSPLTIPPAVMCRFKFRLWLKATVIPRWKCLRLADVAKRWIKESGNLICGGHGGEMWVLLKDYCFTVGHHFDEC